MNQIFDGLLLHPKTKRQFMDFLHNPGHAVLITGPPGSGKKTLGRRLSAGMLGIDVGRLAGHAYFRRVTKPPDKQEISIDLVRPLAGFTSLRVPGGNDTIQRVVLIEAAENLSLEAQNALLKILEEPPGGTVFVLTAPAPGDLLPTVASRVQTIKVIPPPLNDAISHYAGSRGRAEVDSAWRLSGGAAGLMSALLLEGTAHPLKAAVSQAKELLNSGTYGKLLMLNKLSADKSQYGLTLDALARVLAALQYGAVGRQNHDQSSKILASRRLVGRALDQLDHNVSPRLISLKLALGITL